MDSWDLMAVRAYMPAAFALVIAALATWVLSTLQGSPYLGGLADAGRWLPAAPLAFAVLHGSWTTIRLWRAQQGEGLLCSCGGLLGAENTNRRSGLYRKCMKCNRRVPSRDY